MADLWVIGAGPMASAYVSVLKALDVDFDVVGRGSESASRLRQEHGINVASGGLMSHLSRARAPKRAIVAVPVEDLAKCAIALALAGTERLLLEKPAGLSEEEVADLLEIVERGGKQAWVAYNRRFYQSTRLARTLIQADKGVTSFSFEFTEWIHRVVTAPVGPKVRKVWVIANSSHVIDLAFFLGGRPIELAAWSRGSLPWHSAGDRFAGAGISGAGAPFSYKSDWLSPGNWRVEVNTRHRRLLMNPLETLEQRVGESKSYEPLELPSDVDSAFKPGIYEQTKEFLLDQPRDLCCLAEQVENMKLYARIAGY